MQENVDMELNAPKPTVEHIIEAVTELSKHPSNSPSVNLACELIIILIENARVLNKSEMEYHYERGRLSMLNELAIELKSKNK